MLTDIHRESSLVEISFEICKSVVGEDQISRIYLLYDLIIKETECLKKTNYWMIMNLLSGNL